MRWLDASPRRAAPKGHETFILRAASTSSHRLLQRRLLSAHAAQNTTDLRISGLYEVVTWGFARLPGGGLGDLRMREGSWYGFGCLIRARPQEPWCLLILLPLMMQAVWRHSRLWELLRRRLRGWS